MINLTYCSCGKIHIPDEVKNAVKKGEKVTVNILPQFSGIVKNVLKHGTGAMNIDESRVGTESIKINQVDLSNAHGNNLAAGVKQPFTGEVKTVTGRWPANVIFDEEAGKILDEQVGKTSTGGKPVNVDASKSMLGIGANSSFYGNDGRNASRFFYCTKTSKAERNKGCEDLENKNNHPTVKPIKLMEYLCKLITPPNGIVLDPFLGSGTTGKAALNLGFGFVGIEREFEYFEIAKNRINR